MAKKKKAQKNKEVKNKRQTFFPESIKDELVKKYKLDGVILMGYRKGSGIDSLVKVKNDPETIINVANALKTTLKTLLLENPAAGLMALVHMSSDED